MAAIPHESVTMPELSNPQIRKLKGMAQRLEPVVKVGKNGLTPALLKSLDEELKRHELVKVKFADLKEQRKQLAPELAEKTGAVLVALVGNVVVLFRRNEDVEKQVIQF